MGWLLLVLAILAVVFPPLAIVLLALLIMGVFAKGMDAVESPQDQVAHHRRKIRRRRTAEQPDEATDRFDGQSPRDHIIDVRSYPVPPPERLPAPEPNHLKTLP
jgi:hypothetical protein